MDPVVDGEDYSIEKCIISKHGEEKGKEVMREFEATLVSPSSYDIITGKQSEI